MMLTAKQENAKTLAAALGIHEDEAGKLLKCRVTVTHDPLCRFGTRIASHAAAILDRMIDGNSGGNNNHVIELVIGNGSPVTKTNTCIYVQILPDAIVISTERASQSIINPNIHPVFSVLSACYAAAAASRRAVFNDLNNLSPIIIRPSALLGKDLDCLSQRINLGAAVLAGGGAVANGFLLGLSAFDVSGTLHIVDPKKVAPGILNRCLWFGSDDIGYSKSERLSLRAQAIFPHLHLVPHEMTVSEFVRDRLDQHRIERLIVSVDSRRARRSLQTEFPREVYDASTTGIEEIVLHFNHRPSELACMSCIYSEMESEVTHEAHVAELLGVTAKEVKSGFISDDAARRIARKYPEVPMSDINGRAYDTLFKQLCGMGALNVAEDRQVLAPFSFVPILAGTWLAIELIRRVALGVPETPYNYWRASPWATPNIELRQLRRALINCEFCSSPALRAVENRIWPSA